MTWTGNEWRDYKRPSLFKRIIRDIKSRWYWFRKQKDIRFLYYRNYEIFIKHVIINIPIPSLIAKDIFGVQPLDAPTGINFEIKNNY